MSKQILLVEDQQEFQKLVEAAVQSLGDLAIAGTKKDASQLLEKTRYDLILLDVVLPDGNGYDICKEIRASSNNADTPVLFLTGKTEIKDLEDGFSVGADDYIKKPFLPRELKVRVESKLKKTRNQMQLQRGDIDVDLKAQRGTRKGEDLNLTPTEFRLLVHFLQNEGALVTRADLVKAVWGNTHISDHTVDSHISTLRKKLGDAAEELKAVPRKGYRFGGK